MARALAEGRTRPREQCRRRSARQPFRLPDPGARDGSNEGFMTASKIGPRSREDVDTLGSIVVEQQLQRMGATGFDLLEATDLHGRGDTRRVVASVSKHSAGSISGDGLARR